MTDTEKKILEILHMFNEEIPVDSKINLLTGGYIDSFDIVNIVSEIEEAFQLEIEPEDIIPENFDTIEHMADTLNN